jgi:hypothetical protein
MTERERILQIGTDPVSHDELQEIEADLLEVLENIQKSVPAQAPQAAIEVHRGARGETVSIALSVREWRMIKGAIRDAVLLTLRKRGVVSTLVL